MSYRIPPETRAVIFDLNGTMVRDAEYQRLAYRQFFQNHHLHVTERQYRDKAASRLNREVWPAVFGRPVGETEASRFMTEKESLYEGAYEGRVEEIPGLTELLERLRGQEIRLGVATTSFERAAFFVLDALGISQFFEVVITGEQVTCGKPDPEIYRLALSRLRTGPAEAVAFEDSPRGIQAAIAAEIPTVAVLGDYTSQEVGGLEIAGSVRDFREVA